MAAIDESHPHPMVEQLDRFIEAIPQLEALLLAYSRSLVRAELDELYQDLIEEYREKTVLTAYFRTRAVQEARDGTLQVYAFREIELRMAGDGMPLSAALAGLSPSQHLLLIRTGEETKEAAIGLQRAIDLIEQRRTNMAIAMKNLAYPLIVTGMICGTLVSVYGMKLVPNFLTLAPLEAFGPVFRSSYWVGNQLKGPASPIIITTVSALLYAGWWSLANFAGPVRERLGWLPHFYLYRMFVASNACSTLSQLVKANKPPAVALDLMCELATPYERHHYEQWAIAFRAGQTGVEAMSTGLLTKEMLKRIERYSLKGKFDYILREMGGKFAGRTAKTIDKSTGRTAKLIYFAVALLLAALFRDYFALQSVIGSRFG